MAPASIGINLRVTGHCSQGGRKYMEDYFSVAYQQSENEKDLEYAFFGIFDGHGGSEAAKFAKEHLMNEIVNQKLFWSDSDDEVLRAIREGYMQTHYAMWRKQEKWPKTASGLPSTAGTTASVAFIRKGKIYIGHVGDSGIVLGYQENGDKSWKAKPLTQDHKPECNIEKARIMNSGGKVITKSGVPRVVWNRPRVGHKGPVRRSTPFDEIPFLAVARSLGDLWSYNSALNEFVVSPDPDVHVIKIDPKTFRCLIFGTDGLWNVISSNDSIDIARDAEIINERLTFLGGGTASMNDWRNPSKCLVDKALERWSIRKMRADNTSVVTVMLDPPGLPKKDISRQCSTASYGLEYIHMDGEINSQTDYRTIENNFTENVRTNSHANSDDYYYLANGNNLNSQEGIGLDSCYLQSCYAAQRYENSFTYFENQNGGSSSSSNLDNSSSNYVYGSCSSSTAAAAAASSSSSSLVSTSSTNQQQADIYSNGLSFAESYNSLLLSSLENDGNSSSGSSSSSSSSDSSGDEDNGQDVQHIYQSLNETGLAGHDHVYHHYPNVNNEQQQRQYQQACMLDKDGYSLTKLETRCEQRLRNYSCHPNPNSTLNSTRNHIRSEHRQSTFQTYNNDVAAVAAVPPPAAPPATTNYNQYDRISSNYHLNNVNVNNEKNAIAAVNNDSQSKEIGVVVDQHESEAKEGDIVLDTVKNMEVNVADQNDDELVTTNVDLNNQNHKVETTNLDESSIQINEISSSFNETNSPQSSPLSKNDDQPDDNEIDIVMLETNNKLDISREHKLAPSKLFETLANNSNSSSNSSPIITRTTRASKLRFTLKQNDENISLTENQQTNRYTKRTLRSRNSLSKDLKAKTINKKPQQQQHLKRSIVTNEFLKAVNASSSSSSTSPNGTNGFLCKLRSRQHCSNQQLLTKLKPQQQQQQQQQQQVNVWPITRSRRTTTNYNIPSKSSALCANNNHNTNPNINLRNNSLNCYNRCNLRNNPVSSSTNNNHSSKQNSPKTTNRLHNKIIQSRSSLSSPSSSSSSSTSSVSSTTKRSASLRNGGGGGGSSWCSGKNIIQTRNRVQNVKSLIKK